MKIYLVEDNLRIRENLTESLEEILAADVVGAAESETAARLWLAENEWELAVVDMFLAEGNGMGVVRSCQDRDESQKLVVLTNYATRHIRETCLQLGADAIFDKSNEIEQFFHYASEHSDELKRKNRLKL